MMAATLIDQALDAFVAIVSSTAEASGGVFEDHAQAFTAANSNAIDITLRTADSQTLGDSGPRHSVLVTVMQVDMSIYTHSAINSAGVQTPARQLANLIWSSAHNHLMADPTLGGLALRVRWRRASWQRDSADGNAGWATHSYEITLAMREQNLLAPL